MGCCQHEEKKTEEKAAGGCCGGTMKKEGACGPTNAITGFFKKIFGKKCCN